MLLSKNVYESTVCDNGSLRQWPPVNQAIQMNKEIIQQVLNLWISEERIVTFI